MCVRAWAFRLDSPRRRQGRALFGLRGSRPSGVSSDRKRCVNSPISKALDAERGRPEVEPRPQSLRASGTAGRSTGTRRGGGLLPCGRGRQGGAPASARRARGRTRPEVRGRVRESDPSTVPVVSEWPRVGDRRACVPKVQWSHWPNSRCEVTPVARDRAGGSRARTAPCNGVRPPARRRLRATRSTRSGGRYRCRSVATVAEGNRTHALRRSALGP